MIIARQGLKAWIIIISIILIVVIILIILFQLLIILLPIILLILVLRYLFKMLNKIKKEDHKKTINVKFKVKK